MPVVTFSGNAGSYARDIARTVADALRLDYVDQALLVEAAQRLGVPVERIAEIDERTLTLGERMSHILSSFLERSAGIGSTDPMIGTANLEAILARTYEDEAAGASDATISDQAYVDALRSILREIATRGNVVIVGRGGNVLLQDWPDAFHVFVTAPREARIKRMMKRTGIDEAEAAQRVDTPDSGRASYYRKLLHTENDEPRAYHLSLNCALMSDDAITKTILAALAATSPQAS